MRNTWMNENVSEVGATTNNLGNEFDTASGQVFKALVDERSSTITQYFPTAFDDHQQAGRIGVLSLDASAIASSLVASMVIQDSRTGIKWKIERIRDDAFGSVLQGRTALVTSSPMPIAR